MDQRVPSNETNDCWVFFSFFAIGTLMSWQSCCLCMTAMEILQYIPAYSLYSDSTN